MKTPEFLTLAEVLEIHTIQIERFGGNPGLRDLGLLESALSIPQSSYGGKYLHPSLAEMASAYAFHISQNQPFIDGNKRTGLGAALIFLELNGVKVNDPSGKLYDAMMSVSRGEMKKEELINVFQLFF